MQISEAEWRALSHRERRVLVNKERRRRRRRAAALKREEEQAILESQPGYLERLAALEKEKEEHQRREEAQRLLEHEAWLERERVAQEQFQRQRAREERIQREKEEREQLIREEWELLQKREKEAEEKRDKLRREKEYNEQERLQEALATENKPVIHQPTHNPLAPEGYTQPDHKNFGTEKDSKNCPFFLKTGACRFGETCSRSHPRPTSGTTLLIPGMYASLGLREWSMDDRDDAALEYEEGEMYEHFRSFYDDVFPEFAKVGNVIQFKVSCNFEPHLRGNVYVQYRSEEEGMAAYQSFNGRWYAERQLSVQFCPIQRWRNAICGLYSQNRCPKGKHCNFLHVFRNPGGAFSRADRDLPPLSPSPPPSTRYSRRDSRGQSQERRRRRSRSWEKRGRSRSRRRSNSRQRHYSSSPTPSRHSNSPNRRSSRQRHEKNTNGSHERAESHTDSAETATKREKTSKKKKRKRSCGSSPRRRHKHKRHKHKRDRRRSGSVSGREGKSECKGTVERESGESVRGEEEEEEQGSGVVTNVECSEGCDLVHETLVMMTGSDVLDKLPTEKLYTDDHTVEPPSDDPLGPTVEPPSDDPLGPTVEPPSDDPLGPTVEPSH